ASGGPGSTVGDQVGQTYPTTGFPDLPQPICDNGGGELCGGKLFNPNGGHDQPPPEKIGAQSAPLVKITVSLTEAAPTEKKQDEVVNTTNSGSGGSSSGG